MLKIKNLLFPVLLQMLLLLIISGCGKVSQETLSLSSNSQSEASAPNNQVPSELTDDQIVAQYSQAMGGLMIDLVSTQDQPRNQTPVANLSASAFTIPGSYSTQTISYDDTYPYWNYSAGTNVLGTITESLESKYRYFSSATNTWFTKLAADFTSADYANVAYIERLQRIKGSYASNPSKLVYDLLIQEKIVQNGNLYRMIVTGNQSVLSYIGITNDTFKVTSRNILYNATTKIATGIMTLQGNSRPLFIGNMTLSFNNGTMSYITECLYNSRKSYRVTVVGSSNTAETLAYLGKASTYYYNTLGTIITNRLVDNTTIEFQDSSNYSETSTIDGTLQNSIGSRLTNLKLVPKSGYSPRFRQLTIAHVDGLSVSGITFTTRLVVQDCNNCTINGVFYSHITNQTF